MMKTIGIILIVAGIATTIFTGVSFKQEESVLEVGDVEVTQEKEEEVEWPRWAGIAAIAGGGVLFLLGRRSKK